MALAPPLPSERLVKHSAQFRPDQLAWLRAFAARRGQCSVSAILRLLVDNMMREVP